MCTDDKELTKGGNLKRPSLSMVTTWLKETWEDIPAEMVKKSFLKTGISNSMDGNEDDHLLQDSGDSLSILMCDLYRRYKIIPEFRIKVGDASYTWMRLVLLSAQSRQRWMGFFRPIYVWQPMLVSDYNKHMSGVEKSDQLIGKYNSLRRTNRYWKTFVNFF